MDGDIYAFRAAAASESDDLGIAIWRCEEMIDNTLAETGASDFSIFLSGDNNFRYRIYVEYKAHRKAEKPIHLRAIKDYLISKYGAVVSDDCEADDELGIAQCAAIYNLDILRNRTVSETIICSLDKDLRMIPGNHYSFEIRGTSSLGKAWVRPAEKVFVEEFQGLKHFYTQMLVGDPADNIKGVSGIGKVKAEALLKDCTTEQELFEVVDSQYSSEEEMLMTGRCLWIWRKPNDDWQEVFNKYRKEIDE